MPRRPLAGPVLGCRAGRRAVRQPGLLKSALVIEPLTCIFATNAGQSPLFGVVR
jgi:hypothetical protein